MSRYIEADKVLKELHLNHKDVIYIDKNECAKCIEKIQGIDIVRCEECKHWCKGDEVYGICYRCANTRQMRLDDFCSWGEREGE